MHPDYISRLESMLNWLESEGFFLWWNDKSCEWILALGEEKNGKTYPNEEKYHLTCPDKYRLIEQAFHDLIH